MKSKLLLVAVVAVAVIVGGFFLYEKKVKEASVAQGGSGAMPPAGVSVYTVEEKSIVFTKDLPGRVSAVKVAEIRPQVSGIILKRLFTEGSYVKEGQQLYQIDSAPFEAAYESALAELYKAEASLSSAAPKAERYAELVKVGGVSKQENDDVQATFAQAKAAVSAAKAAVTSAKINLGYTKVFSPISGYIGRSSVTEGALVIANQANALATVQQLNNVYVDVTQSAEYILKLRRLFAEGESPDHSKEVELFINGIEYGIKGTLQFSDITVDETTGMVTIRAIFPNPKKELLPGLFVKARVAQSEDSSAILIPQQTAVRQPSGGAVVWVVNSDNIVNPVPVTLGDAYGNSWLVESGLAAGDVIVFEGFQKIRPGAKVNPAPAQAE